MSAQHFTETATIQIEYVTCALIHIKPVRVTVQTRTEFVERPASKWEHKDV